MKDVETVKKIYSVLFELNAKVNRAIKVNESYVIQLYNQWLRSDHYYYFTIGPEIDVNYEDYHTRGSIYGIYDSKTNVFRYYGYGGTKEYITCT